MITAKRGVACLGTSNADRQGLFRVKLAVTTCKTSTKTGTHSMPDIKRISKFRTMNEAVIARPKTKIQVLLLQYRVNPLGSD